MHLLPDTSARSFAKTLVEVGCSADASRVSRWETGRIPAPVDVVAAYERALGLPPGGLVALTILTRKLADPDARAAMILETHNVSAARAEKALDAIVDGDPTGEDWLEFSSYVACHPEQLLLPVSLWRTMASRLVKELGLSLGTAYATRNEAAIVLSEHPRAGQALVHAVGEDVLHSDSLVVADPISLLRAIDARPAGDLVLKLLEQPPGATRAGAAWSAAAKVVRGHFDECQLARLEGIVVRWVRQEGLDAGGIYNRVTDLVAVLPADMRNRIAQSVGSASEPADGPDVSHHSWCETTAARLAAAVARPSGEDEEPMLERLVQEAIFHPHAERRFHAAFCVTLSPYSARVARGAAGVVEEALFGAGQDHVLVERVLVLMTFVVTEAQRELLHRVVDGPDPSFRATALIALAHLPPTRNDATELWPILETYAEADEETTRCALYCAGMTDDEVLERVERDGTAPTWVRRAARWWLHEGPAIREHTRDRPVA